MLAFIMVSTKPMIPLPLLISAGKVITCYFLSICLYIVRGKGWIIILDSIQKGYNKKKKKGDKWNMMNMWTARTQTGAWGITAQG